MCDEFTEREDDAALARKGLSRRDFATFAAAAALSSCTGVGGGASGGRELTERMLTITMDDGIADGFFVHPAKGAYPGIVIWPDIAGLREVFKVMARRLADAGHAVLVVNQYYRSAPAPVLASFAEWRTPEGKAKLDPMREAITSETVARDARAFVAFLDREDAVDSARRIGTSGYCMGGPFAVRTAAAVSDRVGGVASFHGAGLVSNEADSPVQLIGETRASYLFAIARDDDARNPQEKERLREACAAAKRSAVVEVFPADHGWCVADVPAYDPNEADRAWARMMALFADL